MEAIVYTSNTGSTARYAKLLGHELGIPVYSAAEAKKTLPAGAGIIYLGWIMAGKALENKTDRSPEEEDMLDMMLHGGERVRVENLKDVIDWYNSKR